MAKIKNMNDFKAITSKITSFSHAYLFNVNSLNIAYSYVKEFAKFIILGHNYEENDEKVNESLAIDREEYDDLYIVNPNTIGINTEEINRLMSYMETKSLRNNGKRVYIIYGFERLSLDVSNKILKFLEEPSDNLYALLMTENIERVLPTIISRCQKIDLTFDNLDYDNEKIALLQRFLENLVKYQNKMIAYEYEYFNEALNNRLEFYQYFEILERILSKTISGKYEYEKDNIYICGQLLEFSKETLINMLNITNKLKCLVKGNINLNLLLDRYIIEITEELNVCKK